MKVRLMAMLLLVAFMAIVLAVPAQASAAKAQEEVIAVTTSGASPVVPSTASSTKAKLSGGTGGTASSSGSRTAWVKTTMYSITGIPIVDIKSISNWSWSGGSVTAHSWNEPQVNRRGAFNITYSVVYGQYGWRTWNGRAHGCWYQTVKIHVVHSVLKIGVISEWDVLHQYYLYGNGTYKWSSNY